MSMTGGERELFSARVGLKKVLEAGYPCTTPVGHPPGLTTQQMKRGNRP
jgi:hypothetical protein